MFTEEELSSICGLAKVRAMMEADTYTMPKDKAIFYKYLLIGVDEALEVKNMEAENE